MLITLKRTCVLGITGQIINVSVYKANELIKYELASEFIPELERKVIKPENKVISPETKRRGRPPKVKDESN